MDDPDVEEVKQIQPTTDDPQDTEPDPDESILLDSHDNQMWLVKIPKFLMKRWATIDADNVHLATIRVYQDKDADTGKQRMMVILPDGTALDTSPAQSPAGSTRASPAPHTNGVKSANGFASSSRNSAEPDQATEFELEVIHDTVDNQVVVAEKDMAPGSRARSTIRTGRVRHECNLQPVLNARYRRMVKERVKAANTPQRQIQMLEDVMGGSRGTVNRMAGGIPSAAGAFNPLRPPKPVKAPSGQHERFARIPKNQLLDLLFSHFASRTHWTIKDLRARTEQPEVYLKEVLSEIAQLHRVGDKVGMWSLKPNFVQEGAESSRAKLEEHYSSDIAGMDGDDGMDGMDEDDDDDEMEEIS